MAGLSIEHLRWLDQFVRDDQKRLLVSFARYLGDWIGAEDVMQDSLVKVLRLCRSQPDTAPTKALVFRIGMNAAKDSWRKTNRDERLFDQLAMQYPAAVPADLAVSHVAAETLDAMPLLNAQAFLLCKLAKYSSREAGEMLELPPGTVRDKTAKAIAALRLALTEYEGGGPDEGDG
ncbi:RNA polymerase sigma factor [Amycolatopsis sp. NPDC059090]|uniref:RNA polymerase sigma factor n=1 Tax=unclassified Amycolatopsis TaxID=2618356 RepID=UPI00366F8FD2